MLHTVYFWKQVVLELFDTLSNYQFFFENIIFTIMTWGFLYTNSKGRIVRHYLAGTARPDKPGMFWVIELFGRKRVHAGEKSKKIQKNKIGTPDWPGPASRPRRQKRPYPSCSKWFLFFLEKKTIESSLCVCDWVRLKGVVSGMLWDRRIPPRLYIYYTHTHTTTSLCR